MDRYDMTRRGFSLFELLIAIALSGIVLLAASNLMINFGRFSSDVIRSEASLLGTALGSFEEIIRRISDSNTVTYPAASSIAIFVDETNPSTASNLSDDTKHTYRLDGTNLKYKRKPPVGAESAEIIIARDIVTLTFTPVAGTANRIQVVLEAQTTGGPVAGVTREHLETTVTMRARSAA